MKNDKCNDLINKVIMKYYISFCIVFIGFSLFGQKIEESVTTLRQIDSIYTINLKIITIKH